MKSTYSESVISKMRLFFNILPERSRRLYAAIESVKLGHGGDTLIGTLFGISTRTVCNCRKELNQLDIGAELEVEEGRQRKKEGGRKKTPRRRSN